MRVAPEILMLALKDRWQVNRKQRVSSDVERQVEVLRIVQMKGFADKRGVKSNGKENEYREMSFHLRSMKYSRVAGEFYLTARIQRFLSEVR